MSTDKATPRPWKTGRTSSDDLWIEGPNPREAVICDIVSRKAKAITTIDEANAELIVQAVNHFDEVVAALEATATRLDEVAVTLDRWSEGSRTGGWSTYLCSPMEGQANTLRKDAAAARKALAAVKTDSKDSEIEATGIQRRPLF